MKDMKIDLDALRQIEREKSIDFHTVVEAFETALASAYKRSAQANADEARVSVDRVTGDVTLFAQELDDEGNVISEWQEKPRDFGRIVAQTAKQVLLQRLREAEREATIWAPRSCLRTSVTTARVCWPWSRRSLGICSE